MRLRVARTVFRPAEYLARLAVYLAVVIGWYSRRVLAWRLSFTLTADFCIEALEEALARHGRPDIFNTDQGSQFTSVGFIAVLTAAKAAIGMDGKGARRDNIFVERLWRTIKDEEVYLRAYASVSEARASIGPLSRLLQRQAPAFIAWRAKARSGIPHGAAANPGRSIIRADIRSAGDPILFREAELPLQGTGRTRAIGRSGDAGLRTAAAKGRPENAEALPCAAGTTNCLAVELARG